MPQCLCQHRPRVTPSGLSPHADVTDCTSLPTPPRVARKKRVAADVDAAERGLSDERTSCSGVGRPLSRSTILRAGEAFGGVVVAFFRPWVREGEFGGRVRPGPRPASGELGVKDGRESGDQAAELGRRNRACERLGPVAMCGFAFACRGRCGLWSLERLGRGDREDREAGVRTGLENAHAHSDSKRKDGAV